MMNDKSDDVDHRCEGCLHWEVLDYQPEVRTHAGLLVWSEENEFDTVTVPGAWGKCGAVAFMGPQSGSDRFYVQDGSGYEASLKTRGDFGCVEWKSKTEDESTTSGKCQPSD